MSTIVEIPTEKVEKKGSRVNNKIQDKTVIGKITETLGSGDDAKNSIIFLTIKYCMIVGCVISGLVVINYWFFRQKEKVPDFTSDIKLIWEIVVPIITLALGYAFGKSHK